MTARTTGPDHLDDPLDDALAARLRTVLDAVDAGQSQRPSSMPPWDRLQQGMRRAHRARRSRRFRQVAAAGLAIAIVVAGAGAALRVVPRLTSQTASQWPAVPARVPGHSFLYGLPAKGSLSGDTAFVTAIQGEFSEPARSQGPFAHWMKVPAEVKVLFAGDVGPYRLALVEGEWATGAGPEPWQLWFRGPAGASASQLVPDRSTMRAQDIPARMIGSAYQPDKVATIPYVAIALSARPVRVLLNGTPTIDASGRIAVHNRVLTSSDGVYSAQLTPEPGPIGLWAGGRKADDFVPGTQQKFAAQPTYLDLTPVRGGSAEPAGRMDPSGMGSPLDRLAFAMQTSAGQLSGADTFRLLVAEQTKHPSAVRWRAVVGVITLPGGARVIAGGTIPLEAPEDVRQAAADITSAGAAKIIPAATASGPPDDADASIAWVETHRSTWSRGTMSPASTKGPTIVSEPTVSPRDWAGAMGPAGTVKVEWVHHDGSVTSSEAVHTLATTPTADVTSVRFFGADGQQLGTAPVTPLINDQDQLMPQLDAALQAAAEAGSGKP